MNFTAFTISHEPIIFENIVQYLESDSPIFDFSIDFDGTIYKAETILSEVCNIHRVVKASVDEEQTLKPIVQISSTIPDYEIPDDMYKFYTTLEKQCNQMLFYNGGQVPELFQMVNELRKINDINFLQPDELCTSADLCCNDDWSILEKTDLFQLNIRDWVKFLVQQRDSYYINLNPYCCDYGIVIQSCYSSYEQNIIVARSFTEFINKLKTWCGGETQFLATHLTEHCDCFKPVDERTVYYPFYFNEQEEYEHITKLCIPFKLIYDLPKYLTLEILEEYSGFPSWKILTII